MVQLARHRKARADVAVKFFIDAAAFALEKTLYTSDSPLGPFLPQARSSQLPARHQQCRNDSLFHVVSANMPACFICCVRVGDLKLTPLRYESWWCHA